MQKCLIARHGDFIVLLQSQQELIQLEAQATLLDAGVRRQQSIHFHTEFQFPRLPAQLVVQQQAHGGFFGIGRQLGIGLFVQPGANPAQHKPVSIAGPGLQGLDAGFQRVAGIGRTQRQPQLIHQCHGSTGHGKFHIAPRQLQQQILPNAGLLGSIAFQCIDLQERLQQLADFFQQLLQRSIRTKQLLHLHRRLRLHRPVPGGILLLHRAPEQDRQRPRLSIEAQQLGHFKYRQQR